VPEGDTIAWTANRIRPALEGSVPDEIWSPRNPRWPQRLGGQAITRVGAHGKHLFLHFDGRLVIHSHLGMSGYWTVLRTSPSPPGTWLAIRCGEQWVVQRHGPTLELLTEGRIRFDQRLSALGPDVLAPEFDRERFFARLRSDDQTRAIGDALLDQRNVAGIGNIWKAEGCWEAGLDPWRPLGSVSDDEALAVIDAIRPRMLRSAQLGPREIRARAYNRAGRPCPRCGEAIAARAGGYAPLAIQARLTGAAPRPPAGDANRITYWCPGCQR
jgi:endonuclease-8